MSFTERKNNSDGSFKEFLHNSILRQSTSEGDVVYLAQMSNEHQDITDGKKIKYDTQFTHRRSSMLGPTQ